MGLEFAALFFQGLASLGERLAIGLEVRLFFGERGTDCFEGVVPLGQRFVAISEKLAVVLQFVVDALKFAAGGFEIGLRFFERRQLGGQGFPVLLPAGTVFIRKAPSPADAVRPCRILPAVRTAVPSWPPQPRAGSLAAGCDCRVRP